MLARVNRHFVPAYWDDFFNDNFYHSFNHANRGETSPAVNVTEGEKEFSIEFAVPGMSRKEIRIDLENDILTVSSEHKENKESKKQNFVRREFRFNSFKRSFQLPETVDQESINANHDAGILTIHLPKKKEVVEKVVKTIEIK